jgi:hypothetical protein
MLLLKFCVSIHTGDCHCQEFIGNFQDNGINRDYPYDIERLGKTVENICYYNGKGYLNFH